MRNDENRWLSDNELAQWALTGSLPDWAQEGKRKDTRKGRQRDRVDNRRDRGRRNPKKPVVFLGIDGEGQTTAVGRHLYTMIAVANESGKAKYIRNPEGLSTEESLQFITSFGSQCRFFAYSFGYDLTKILEDLDDLSLYKLFRPELRRAVQKNGRRISVPVWWPAQGEARWSLDYLNGQLKVKRCLGYYGGLPSWGKAVTVCDIWKFFQGKFTSALEDWKVPTNVSEEDRKVILDRMREMKDKRADFDKMKEEEVRAYCIEECKFMAELARLLTEAHVKADIPLKSYYGAGSSASAMLEKMGIKEHIRVSREKMVLPDGLSHAIACGFAGGRFENSVIGSVEGPLWSYDISSAYPYQITFLPCLIHGRWEYTRNRRVMEEARAAIVHYSLREPSQSRAWGPFPFRFKTGSICFPESGQTGWVWRDEFLAGEKLFPNVQFLGGYAYHCECDCQPFQNIPRYYRQRLLIGKEGPGIVLKLGTNSCYGKTAQFIGGEPGIFTSWIWAGLITSGCRSQILNAMGKHADLDNLLMIATDGIASRERLQLDIPRNTGTFDCIDDKGELANKPLGGWEEKELEKGLFLARPGIYFPLNPTKKEIKKVRARGIGRASVYDHWDKIVQAFEAGAEHVKVTDLSRFIGAKSGITRAGSEPDYRYKRSRDYGRWVMKPVKLGFSPFPKRSAVKSNGQLALRRVEGESAPYQKGVVSEESEMLQRLAIELEEQPQGPDYGEWYECQNDE